MGKTKKRKSKEEFNRKKKNSLQKSKERKNDKNKQYLEEDF